MEAYLFEWGSLLLRWLHVIAAIAWIGSSFFFMRLDASLRPAEGLGGVTWQVHSGGFYEMRKYLVAPERLPQVLTWHKWEAYWTWISGFLLLIWIYYCQSSLFLIDPAVMAMTPLTAAAIGIGALVAGWVIYDLLCKSPLGQSESVLAGVGFVFIVAASWGFAQVYSARGALIHIGSLMATIMTANVFLVIIPNQRKVIEQLLANQPPDPALGEVGKQRSTHNNYLTLPVVFLMLSNHYPMTYASKNAIPVLVAFVLVAGALVRHFYNERHTDHARSPWWAWGAAALAIVAAAITTVVASPAARDLLSSFRVARTVSAPPDAAVDVIAARCSMCHTGQPVWPGIQIAPKGVILDSRDSVWREADAIRMQSVLSHAMPPNNITQMSVDERRVVGNWLLQQ